MDIYPAAVGVPYTPGRHALRHGPTMEMHPRARSPARIPQPILRNSSSFGQLSADGSLQAPRRSPSSSVKRPVPVKTETAALMARVRTVSSKADQILAYAGRPTREVRSSTAGAYQNDRLIDLTERLARLENLLDEVASLGTSRVGTSRIGTARVDESPMHSAEAPRTLSFRSETPLGTLSVAPPPPTVPLVGTPVQVHGPTPRSTARFIEVAPSPTPSIPPPIAATPPVPMPGMATPSMPPPMFYGRDTTPTGTSVYPAPPVWNIQATPRVATPRVGSRSMRPSVGGYARSETPQLAPQYASFGLETSRSFSQPRTSRTSSVTPAPIANPSPWGPAPWPPLPMVPVQMVAPPVQMVGVMPGMMTPSMPPPTGLLTPFSFGSSLRNGVDDKIRNWLSTIPIGAGDDRGWDDSQITGIATFAQDRHLEHLPAEDIYKRYVEHQVDAAAAEG